MKKLTVIMALTLLLLSSCSEKIVYVKTPCPKLVPYDVNTTEIKLDYEVYYENV